MAKNVLVGCKLPNGIIISDPINANIKVTLNGKNKALVIGAEYSTTEVDEEVWGRWHAANAKFEPVKSGAIFVAKSLADVNAIAKEYSGRKTGLEPMQTDGEDERASGVKTLDVKE